MNNSISEFSDAKYLVADKCEFYKTEGKLLGLKTDKDYKRVMVFRMFPLSNENCYLSIRDEKEEEIGIIKDLKTFSQQQQQLINEELDRRYFCPKILSIYSIKDDFGLHVDAETDCGRRQFLLKDLAVNSIRLDNDRVMVIDIDGNRYEFENIMKAGDLVLKYLEIWV